VCPETKLLQLSWEGNKQQARAISITKKHSMELNPLSTKRLRFAGAAEDKTKRAHRSGSLMQFNCDPIEKHSLVACQLHFRCKAPTRRLPTNQTFLN